MQEENQIDEEEEIRDQKEVHEFAREIKEKVEETNKINKEQQDQLKVNMNQTMGPIINEESKRKKENVLAQFFFKPPRIPEHTYIIMRMIIPFQERSIQIIREKSCKIIQISFRIIIEWQIINKLVCNHMELLLVIFLWLQIMLSKIIVEKIAQQQYQKQLVKEQELVIVEKVCTADEILWIIRIILKDLKIDLKYEKLLQLFHKDAPKYYNATSSLKEVCKEFVDINHTLKNVLRIFHAIKPMLAAKKSPEEIRKLIEGKELLVETKFDGERIQCHFTPEVIRFFTRNSNDYAYLYKDKLGEIIRQSVQAQCATLDGEIIVLIKKLVIMLDLV